MRRMPDTLLAAILLKPFVALAYGCAVWAVQRAIWGMLPDGRLRRVLFAPLRIHKQKRVDPVSRQVGRSRRP